ncbi:MAG: hypothetical protein PHV36_10135 [Elusimicrobiales bacterium]|nr:hypothetical protein [Elusimicrobiales bacterium]
MKRSIAYALALALIGAAVYAAMRTGTAARVCPSFFCPPDRAGELKERTLNEYHYNYKDDRGLPLFSWVYAGFLSDDKGGLYQFSCTYYGEESTYYPGFLVLLKKMNKDGTGGKVIHKFSWKEGPPRFTESADLVRVAAGSPARGFEINVTGSRHTLKVWRGTDFSLDLSFDERMDPVFIYNRGNPIPIPTGGQLYLVDDFMHGEGSLKLGASAARVGADVTHERVYSPIDQWQFTYEDWLCVFHKDFYALLFITGERGLEGGDRHLPDGFVYFRKEKKYVPLDELEVRYAMTAQTRILKKDSPVMMETPVSLSASASGKKLKLSFNFEGMGPPEERELAMTGRGYIEYKGKKTEYDRLLAWEEFMR